MACIDNGRAIVHFTVAPSVEAELRSYLAIYDLAQQPRLVDLPDFGVSPWRAACSAESHQLFVATASGALYAIALDDYPFHVTPLGTFPHYCPTRLECTADGTHVLVCGMKSAGVWSRSCRQCLWQRGDLDITSATFTPDSRRLFCGLANGRVIELEVASGETIGQIASHGTYCTGIAVSPQSECMASIDSSGHVTMTGIGTGEVRWTKRFAVLQGGVPAAMPVCPRFSPSGTEIALICARRGSQVIVCDAATGRVREVKHWTGGDIRGCTSGRDGTFYFWDDRGVITSWNQRSGEFQHFSPAADSLARRRNMRSSSHEVPDEA